MQPRRAVAALAEGVGERQRPGLGGGLGRGVGGVARGRRAAPAAAETSTNRPSSLALQASWKAREVCCTVRTSRSCSKSQSARSVSVKVLPPRQPPTRCTRPSTRPNSAAPTVGPARGGLLGRAGRPTSACDAAAGRADARPRDDRLEPLGVGVGADDGGAGRGQPAHQRRPPRHRPPAPATTTRPATAAVLMPRLAVLMPRDARGGGDDGAELLAQGLVEHAERELVRQHRVDQSLRRPVRAAARSAPSAQTEAGAAAT